MNTLSEFLFGGGGWPLLISGGNDKGSGFVAFNTVCHKQDIQQNKLCCLANEACGPTPNKTTPEAGDRILTTTQIQRGRLRHDLDLGS